MDPVGNTPPESSQVKAIAFANLGSSLFSASRDSLKIFDLDPSVQLRKSLEVAWDKISDMKVSNNSQLVAGMVYTVCKHL